MTLDETLLERLNSWRPPGEGRHTFAFLDTESGTSVRLAVDRLDSLSCQLWELGVTRSPAAVANDPSLKVWAERVADRATGLLEPLHIVEIDEPRGQALLRSDKPTAKNDDLFYYEVLLHRTGAAHVARYKGSRQPSKRQQLSFILTREAVAKLIADLAAAQ